MRISESISCDKVRIAELKSRGPSPTVPVGTHASRNGTVIKSLALALYLAVGTETAQCQHLQGVFLDVMSSSSTRSSPDQIGGSVSVLLHASNVGFGVLASKWSRPQTNQPSGLLTSDFGGFIEPSSKVRWLRARFGIVAVERVSGVSTMLWRPALYAQAALRKSVLPFAVVRLGIELLDDPSHFTSSIVLGVGIGPRVSQHLAGS